MKKIFNLTLVIAVTTFLIQSCKPKPNDKDVQAVVESFFKSLANEDYDKAKELGTDGTDEMIEMIKMSSTMVPDSLLEDMKQQREEAKKATLTFGATTFNEDGTTAEVKYTSSALGREEIAHLKKVEGKWLLDLEAGMPQ